MIQNRALRRITGCHAAAATDHLHAETEVLPVKSHLKLLSAQFLARALQPDHPSHDVVRLPPGPRKLKETLSTKVGHLVEPFLQDGTIPPASYKETINAIHTKVVSDAVSASAPNRVLARAPPKICKRETLLPRQHRTTLAQLRSGHCSHLKDFQLPTSHRQIC